MRTLCVILLVVALSCLVASTPLTGLRARLEAALQESQKGRSTDEGNEDESWRQEIMPWMSFSSLIGKCEVMKLMQIPLGPDSILFHACPKVYEIASRFEDATEEDIATGAGFIRKYSVEFQCSTLMAEMQSVYYLLWKAGKKPEEDPYLKGSQFLYDSCEGVLNKLSANNYAELQEDLQELDDALRADKNEASMRSLFGDLLKTSNKKR